MRKKILYVTDVFPPRCGGSGWSVYFFARALREQGYDVSIFSLDGLSREYDGFHVESIPLSQSKLPFVANYARENSDLPKIAQRLKQISKDFDIWHAHHRFSAVALAMSEPSRFFVTIRDYWPICFCSRSVYRTGTTCTMNDFARCSGEENTWKGIAAPLVYHWFDARLSRWNAMIRKAEKIFCISNYVREQLTPLFDANQLIVLPNFAEAIPSYIKKDLPESFILYVGRLEKNKGAHLLPEIMERSKVRLPLLIVGEGSLRKELEQEFKSRSVDVQFLEYLEYPEMLSVLSRSRFLLFPSVWQEPLGRVLIEAGMMSKPVITFSHPGGHHDIVENGVNGLMANSIEEYSAAIAHLTDDTVLTKAFSENARKLYERNFSPESIIPRLVEYYSH